MNTKLKTSAWTWRAFDPDDGHYGAWGAWKLSNYEPPRQPDRWFQVVALPAGTPGPLSDEQIAALVPAVQSGWTREQYCQWMARAVERAHGICARATHKRYATEEEEMTARGSPPLKFLGWGDCKCTLTQYCDGRCNPLYADEPANAPPPRPLAWAVFAPNGNVRLWSTDCEAVRKFAAEQSLPLTELYAHPPSA